MRLLPCLALALLIEASALRAARQEPATTAPQPARAAWVSELYANHPSARLVDLVIPGTHDSGSHAITPSSPLAPGAPELYAKLQQVTAMWAKTQDRTLEEQLFDGIRYLDLRVAIHEQQLVLVHSLVSCGLAEALAGVQRFARAHPREPVLLDLQAMPHTGAHDELHALLQTILGEHLFTGAGPPSAWTLKKLWADDRAIIVLSTDARFAERESEYRSRMWIDSVWTNSRRVRTLRERLDSKLRSRDRECLQCAYLTFTPKLDTLITDQIDSARGLAAISEPLFGLPGEWIPRWLDEGLRPNIISVDFYDRTDLVEAAIDANRRLLAD